MGAPKKKGAARDYHRPGHLMIRLTEDVVPALQALAARNDRPLTRELRRAVIAHLEREGMWPPPNGEGGKG